MDQKKIIVVCMNHRIYFIRVVRKHFVRDTRSVLIWQCGHVNSITYTLIRNDFGTTKTLFKSRSIRINRANLIEIISEPDTEDFQSLRQFGGICNIIYCYIN